MSASRLSSAPASAATMRWKPASMRRRPSASAMHAASAAAAGSIATRSSLNWRSSVSENLRSSSQRSTSGSNRFQALAGCTVVPRRGRAVSRPLAVSIFTASRVTERLTAYCPVNAASVGNVAWS